MILERTCQRVFSLRSHRDATRQFERERASYEPSNDRDDKTLLFSFSFFLFFPVFFLNSPYLSRGYRRVRTIRWKREKSARTDILPVGIGSRKSSLALRAFHSPFSSSIFTFTLFYLPYPVFFYRELRHDEEDDDERHDVTSPLSKVTLFALPTSSLPNFISCLSSR